MSRKGRIYICHTENSPQEEKGVQSAISYTNCQFLVRKQQVCQTEMEYLALKYEKARTE